MSMHVCGQQYDLWWSAFDVNWITRADHVEILMQGPSTVEFNNYCWRYQQIWNGGFIWPSGIYRDVWGMCYFTSSVLVWLSWIISSDTAHEEL